MSAPRTQPMNTTVTAQLGCQSSPVTATLIALADEIERSEGLIRMIPGQGTEQLGIRKTAMVIAALRGLAQRWQEPCPYCGDGKHTGLPGNACENCMNTGLKYPDGIQPEIENIIVDNLTLNWHGREAAEATRAQVRKAAAAIAALSDTSTDRGGK